MKESDFQKAIIDHLVVKTDGVWYRQNAGTAYISDGKKRRAFRGTPKGAGDIVGIQSGFHVEVEVKVKAKHEQHQQDWGKRLEQAGGIYVLVRYHHMFSPSQNVERAMRLVDEAINKKLADRITAWR